MKEAVKSIVEFIVAVVLFVVVCPIFIVCYAMCAVIVGIMDIAGLIDE